MTTIQSKDKTLLVLEVAESYHGFSIHGKHINYVDRGMMSFAPLYLDLELPEGEWSIVGTITKEEVFDFDPEPYVDRIGDGWGNYGYLDYMDKTPRMDCVDFSKPQQSFISLLESHGRYIVNPMGETPTFPMAFIGNCPDKEIYEKWKSYEEKTLKQGNKFLILELKKDKV